jgi:hypothetical protein
MSEGQAPKSIAMRLNWGYVSYAGIRACHVLRSRRTSYTYEIRTTAVTELRTRMSRSNSSCQHAQHQQARSHPPIPSNLPPCQHLPQTRPPPNASPQHPLSPLTTPYPPHATHGHSDTSHSTRPSPTSQQRNPPNQTVYMQPGPRTTATALPPDADEAALSSYCTCGFFVLCCGGVARGCGSQGFAARMHRAATTCYLYGSILAPGTRLAGQNWCRLHSASAKRDGQVGVAGTRARWRDADSKGETFVGLVAC